MEIEQHGMSVAAEGRVEFLVEHPVERRVRGRRLGGASMELMWALAARAGGMVIEANFHCMASAEGQLPAPRASYRSQSHQ